MRFLRTASTGRLLAVLAGLVAAIGGGTALAVAATSGGPVPKAKPLASALHQALSAKPVGGIFAHISFTNGLISSSDFTGGARDPLLQGASGRIWVANDGRLRLELQTTDGDAEIMVGQRSFWVSDPMSKTVYRGTLPADQKSSSGTSPKPDAVPTIAQLQSDINRLMGHVDLSGAGTSNPTDVGGRPAYSVAVSPKHSGGLIGQARVAWDALTGVPLDVAVYARGNGTPVLELKADDISYGPGAVRGAFNISPPPSYKVVQVASAAPRGTNPTGPKSARKQTEVTGVSAVQSHLPFRLAAPSQLDGLQRQAVKLLDWGGHPAALVTYGQNLGGIAVVEQSESGGSGPAPTIGGGPGGGNGPSLSLPTVTITSPSGAKLATGTELATPLGTIIHYAIGKVGYTILGSVPTSAAEPAAQALAAASTS